MPSGGGGGGSAWRNGPTWFCARSGYSSPHWHYSATAALEPRTPGRFWDVKSDRGPSYENGLSRVGCFRGDRSALRYWRLHLRHWQRRCGQSLVRKRRRRVVGVIVAKPFQGVEKISELMLGRDFGGHLAYTPGGVFQRLLHHWCCAVVPSPQQPSRRPHAQPVVRPAFTSGDRPLRRRPAERVDQGRIDVGDAAQEFDASVDDRRVSAVTTFPLNTFPRGDAPVSVVAIAAVSHLPLTPSNAERSSRTVDAGATTATATKWSASKSMCVRSEPQPHVLDPPCIRA